MSSKYPIKLLADFDGVIHAYTSKWTRPDEILDGPVEGAFDWIREMHAEGVEIVIYTARLRGTPLKKDDPHIPVAEIEAAIRAWFVKHGLETEQIDKLGFEYGKPHATLYIDDRAMCFRGRFPKVHQIQRHKQWNKAHPKDILIDDTAAAVGAAQARGVMTAEMAQAGRAAVRGASSTGTFVDPTDVLRLAIEDAVRGAQYQLDPDTIELVVRGTMETVLWKAANP